MGRGNATVNRGQQITLIYAVMTCLLVILFAQFLLLMVAIDGFLGNRHDILLPSILASAVCFAASCGLLRAFHR